MLSSSLQVTIALWQPLHLRMWRRIADSAHVLWHALAQRRQRQRDWSALADLNANTLKDIGAPEWLVLDAADRRDVARQRLNEFSTWRGV
jgi:hypothetical protein